MDATETRRDEIDRSIDRSRAARVDVRATDSGGFPRVVIARAARRRGGREKETNTYLDTLTNVYTSGRNECTTGTKKHECT